MADRRLDIEENGRAKRQKTSNGTDMNPKANPYLAHMYDEDDGYSSGYSSKKSTGNLLSGLTRHNTTAEQANAAEDGPNNPFTGRPLSKRYFNILKTRRNLPVQTQRYAISHAT
jgi:pre-mRNA-splicing factor ATP-dependent RNA helicase DHX15/PRP43